MLYAGIDEVGVSSVAGSMMASVVVLPENHGIKELPIDSKRLSEEKIEKIAKEILEVAIICKTYKLSAEEVDKFGDFSVKKLWNRCANYILKEKKRRNIELDKIIVDGKYKIPALKDVDFINHEAIVGADDKYDNVSASAIVSKYISNLEMYEAKEIYPNFSFDNHKGYLTVNHKKELMEHGLTPFHRKTFLEIKDGQVKFNDINASRKFSTENLEKCALDIIQIFNYDSTIFSDFEKNVIMSKYCKMVFSDKTSYITEKVQFYMEKANIELKKKLNKKHNILFARTFGEVDLYKQYIEELKNSNLNKYINEDLELNNFNIYKINQLYFKLKNSI